MKLIECRKCYEWLSKNEFYKATKQAYYDKICKDCKLEINKRRRRETKNWCVEYKGGKCEMCGYDKCFGSLDFHHVNIHEKDFQISCSKTNKEKLKKELDKCILVCKNCHGEIHY